MNRRVLIALLNSALCWPSGVRAQQPATKRYRIGMLEVVPVSSNASNLDAFRKGMEQLGYVEGASYVIEYRSADGFPERFPQLVAELVDLPVDVIVTRGTPAALAAKSATAAVPIVMASSGDPVGVGIVSSLARPGGNVTGLSAFSTELAGKRLEIVKEILPTAKRFAFLGNMSNPVNAPQWAETQRTAKTLGVDVDLLDIRSGDDVSRAIDAAVAQKIGAVLVGNDTVTQTSFKLIAELSAKHRLPVVHSVRDFVDAGGFMSFRVSYEKLYFRAASYVGKILKGAKPADLPIEQPTAVDLVINLKAAKALGLSIPMSVIARADEVIE